MPPPLGRWWRRASSAAPGDASARGMAVAAPKTSVTVSESIQHSEPAGTSSRVRYQSSPWMSRKSANRSLARSRVSVRRRRSRSGWSRSPTSAGSACPGSGRGRGCTLVMRRRGAGGVPGGRGRTRTSRGRASAVRLGAERQARRRTTVAGSRAGSASQAGGSPLASGPQVDSTHAMKVLTACGGRGGAGRVQHGLGWQRLVGGLRGLGGLVERRRRRWRGPRTRDQERASRRIGGEAGRRDRVGGAEQGRRSRRDERLEGLPELDAGGEVGARTAPPRPLARAAGRPRAAPAGAQREPSRTRARGSRCG